MQTERLSKIKEEKGSYSVEAAFVMSITVMVIASVVTFSMFLSGRVKASAAVRYELELMEGEMFNENTLISTREISKKKAPVQINETDSASYSETAEKEIINVPKALRKIRLIKLITE